MSIYFTKFIRKPVNKQTADSLGWKGRDRELKTIVVPRADLKQPFRCPLCKCELNPRNLNKHIIKAHPDSSAALKITADHHDNLMFEKKRLSKVKENEIRRLDMKEQSDRRRKQKYEERLAGIEPRIDPVVVTQKNGVLKKNQYLNKNGKLIGIVKIKKTRKLTVT